MPRSWLRSTLRPARLDRRMGAGRAPRDRVVSPHPPASQPGMPGPCPGRAVAVRSDRALDPRGAADATVLRQMLAAAVSALTGEPHAPDGWRRLFGPSDVVGIKVNCVGHPHVVSSPELVAEIVGALVGIGIVPARICVYDRFQDHLDRAGYARRLPGVEVLGAEPARGDPARSDPERYDPETYVEARFGEERATRSHAMRLVTERLTKIVNVAALKDHSAAGITGCLKNIAYGSFSNVARSHVGTASHTRTFVGTLAAVEPLRSRTVLQVMDAVRGIWHGGPFAPTERYVFHPRRILVATDPVAVDRLALELVEARRRAAGAPSLWTRAPRLAPLGDPRWPDDPGLDLFVREPGHVAHAARLGLGRYARARIRLRELEIR